MKNLEKLNKLLSLLEHNVRHHETRGDYKYYEKLEEIKDEIRELISK